MTPDPVVWGDFTREALDAAYNNTAAVAHSAETLANLTALSVITRQNHTVGLNLAYGAGERQKVDLFACGKPDAPLFVFIHGGYWQRNSKDMFSAMADGPLALGFDVALIGYTLAPEADLTGIIHECETAIRLIRIVGPSMGIAARRILVSGWSAGGHLAARLVEMPEVEAALAISGIFDLEPIRHCYLQDKLRLTTEEARLQSPIHRLDRTSKPIHVVVGGDELPELRRQSADYVASRRALGLPTTSREIRGLNHFSILERFRSVNLSENTADFGLSTFPAAQS
jgi:arylformamidase